ncbi:hypothetical protein ROJ8625_00161 [Roseivivax jejudonensis]|uniref:Peptidase S12 Pab87-related C-terminal domain-containing protein n=1 Tax=Roseivivax jejudonensis TaxID=1529041 RepID=A0A1X6Y455_9RHOB|nr:hypothetical protein [Roseivivax jejudonensis]SLN10096.1 hypothetical protein ROJ8625_00161 [Roseivivax jejudonensis]
MIRAISALVAAVIAAAPALAQTLPSELEGSWDVSDDACAEPGTSVTRVDITAGRIDTFGGNAQIREVERIGDVVFAAGDFEQLEGAAAVEPRTREYFRFDSRDGAGRMTFVWKDVRTDVLVRCDGA